MSAKNINNESVKLLLTNLSDMLYLFDNVLSESVDIDDFIERCTETLETVNFIHALRIDELTALERDAFNYTTMTYRFLYVLTLEYLQNTKITYYKWKNLYDVIVKYF